MNTADDDMIAQARELAASRGGQRVFADLTFAIPAAAFIALVGPNGCGKTTLLETLLGLVPLRAGSLQVLGKTPRKARGAIGYVPQSQQLAHDSQLLGREFVAAALDGQRPGIPWRRQQTAAAVDQALRAVDALHLATRKLALLSGGQRRRLLIAQALVNRPRLLLMDEPLAQLDPAAQMHIIRLLDRLRREQGVSVMCSTHDINPLAQVADRALYLVGGRGRMGTIDAIMTDTVLTELYGVPMHVLHARGRFLVLQDSGASAQCAEHGSTPT